MGEHPRETELERRLRERAAAEEDSSTGLEAPLGDPSAPGAGENNGTPEVDAVAALEEDNAALRDQLLRARAEFDNFRKRTAREVERIRKTAAESVIHELLGALDNLELALKHSAREGDPLTAGVRLVHKQILDVLERNGLEKIDAVGKRFDPNIHEAVAQSVSDHVAPDHVIEEFQRGYRLGGQILRPSKVLVSRSPDAARSEA
jgi:molecular chaperone GrpE